MTGTETAAAEGPGGRRRFDWLHVVLLVLVVGMVAAGVTYWVVTTYVFPSEFRPVTLSGREEQVLEEKLERLESWGPGREPAAAGATPAAQGALQPEAYSEAGARREIAFTERELNSLLARNTDLAQKLAIDLSENLLSARLLVPVDEDFPVLGGQVIKVRTGVELAYREGKPVVVLKGISVMGVPLPNAWVGGIKNIDLIKEYGTSEGFWKSFSDGVENIQVADGELVIKLRE